MRQEEKNSLKVSALAFVLGLIWLSWFVYSWYKVVTP